MNDKPWYHVFTFMRDGITGTQLLGMVLVVGMLLILLNIQRSERGASKKLDLAWIFADDKTGKVSRSGLMIFGGFLLGCWIAVDAESTGHLDWAFFGTFLAYCAGVRVIEVFKPQRSPESDPVPGKTTTTTAGTVTEEVIVEGPAPVNPLAKGKTK